MKKMFFLQLLGVFATFATAATLEGRWKTFDDKTKKATGIITLWQEDGVYFGRIERVLNNPGATYIPCVKCKDDYKGKNIIGMVIIRNMTKNGAEWGGGTILDPDNGNYYGCRLTLKSDDELLVRGFIGTPLLGRSQLWKRVR